MKKILMLILVLSFLTIQYGFSQVIYQDDFEGSGNITWVPLFYNNTNMQWEENIQVVPNPFGSGNVGKLEDADTSYTGAALGGGDVFTFDHIAIQADVYCYVGIGTSTSRYTGVALMADTSMNLSGEISTRYVKVVADFDDNLGAGPRIRLYNSDLNTTTFQYTFDVKFYANDIPGGIPATDGWHNFRLEARTLNPDSVEYIVYFDGNLVGGGPVYDHTYDTGSGIHTPYTSGTFGLFAFQQGDVLPGYFDNVLVEQLTTGIDDQKLVLTGYELKQNYPNPFNPTTKISFVIPNSDLVQMDIYNNIGQKVRNLVNRNYTAGAHEVIWDGRNDDGLQVPAGIYYYRIKAGDFQQTQKMLLVK
jgi:hypothetical protein